MELIRQREKETFCSSLHALVPVIILESTPRVSSKRERRTGVQCDSDRHLVPCKLILILVFVYLV